MAAYYYYYCYYCYHHHYHYCGSSHRINQNQLMLVMVSSSNGSQQATLIPRTLLYPISVMLLPSLAAAIAFTFNFHNDFTLMTKSIYQRGNIVTRKKILIVVDIVMTPPPSVRPYVVHLTVRRGGTKPFQHKKRKKNEKTTELFVEDFVNKRRKKS